MDYMIFSLSVWLMICQLKGLVLGYCLYGDDTNCAFQCHCAVYNECSGGTCPSGCITSLPSGYTWSGPSCQIGNVGLYKSTNMTAAPFYQNTYPANGAIDGIIPDVINTHCAHLSNADGVPVEWWTDLGNVYKIYNITIYARKDGPDIKLQQFNLTIYNTSDNEVLCGYHYDAVYTHITITCPRPLIGRYVHFMRKAKATTKEGAVLCEVVIIGHRYIDCTQCPVGVNCNDVTGCVTCHGSYQPDCIQKCEDGIYGTNCQDQCGQCKTNTVCDSYNGTCHDGCQIWWTDTKCNTYIETPKNTHENLMLINKTGDIIQIGWEHINGIAVNLRRFYGYIIQYSIDLDDANYRDVGIVSFDSDPYWKIENLQINTIYYIKVTPYRKVGDLRETGKAYDTLKVKTDCSVPETPVISETKVLTNEVGPSYVIIVFKVLSSIKPICNPIRKVTLFYKKKTLSNSTAIYLLPTETCTVFVAEENAEYEIKLVVEDNEGYMSSSDIFSVLVKGADNWSSQRISLIAAVVVNVILIVVIIILVTQLWKLRQKKMQHSSNNLSMMSTDQRHDNSIILQDRNDTVTSDNGIHYEDISANTEGEDIVESQYEGVSAEAHRIYQNNMISGPYEELKK